MYVKDNLPYEKIKNRPKVESLWIKIKIGLLADRRIFYIGTTYRPPNEDRDYFERIISTTKSITKGGYFVLLGDFNFPGTPDQHVAYINEELNSRQLINQPTHEYGNILDLIFTNLSKGSNIEFHTETEVVPVNFSDHCMIYTVISMASCKGCNSYGTVEVVESHRTECEGYCNMCEETFKGAKGLSVHQRSCYHGNESETSEDSDEEAEEWYNPRPGQRWINYY